MGFNWTDWTMLKKKNPSGAPRIGNLVKQQAVNHWVYGRTWKNYLCRVYWLVVEPNPAEK
jgi:hypothetical protein